MWNPVICFIFLFICSDELLTSWLVSVSELSALRSVLYPTSSFSRTRGGEGSVVVACFDVDAVETDKVCPDGKHGQCLSRISTNKVTSHSAAKSWVVRHLADVRHFYTLTQGDNSSFVWLFEVRHWAVTLYQLAVGNARTGFGWKPSRWMEIAECPHTMGPTLGAKFVPWVLPLHLLGDGRSTGPMVNADWKLCNDSLVWQKWCLLNKYQGKRKDSTMNKNNSQIVINDESKLIKPLHYKLQL